VIRRLLRDTSVEDLTEDQTLKSLKITSYGTVRATCRVNYVVKCTTWRAPVWSDYSGNPA
jgi:hypothetical protein